MAYRLSKRKGTGILHGIDRTKNGRKKTMTNKSLIQEIAATIENNCIVRPSFNGINIKITGRNRNEIKDYLYDVFDIALNEIVPAFDNQN